jgi:hypothetical protein
MKDVGLNQGETTTKLHTVELILPPTTQTTTRPKASRTPTPAFKSLRTPAPAMFY